MKIVNTNFNNKTILITGGAGFIGSSLAMHLQEKFTNSNIIIFDCFRSEETFSNGNLKSFGHYKNLIGFKGNIICGDINKKEDLKLLNEFNFDFIFHQAAISDTRVADQSIIMSTNVNSFFQILEIAKRNKSKVVYASSAATYGSLPSPQTEGLEDPENPYGFSKLIMDQVAARFAIKNPNISIIGLRYFNVYGPREFFKEKTSSMVIQLAMQILNGLSPRLFEGSDKILRDFINIEDVIEANIKACSPKKNGVYNVGTGNPRSFKDIVDILQKELGTNFEIDYFPNPYNGYQMHTQAETSSASKNLDFKSKISLEDGIKSYISEIKRLHQFESL